MDWKLIAEIVVVVIMSIAAFCGAIWALFNFLTRGFNNTLNATAAGLTNTLNATATGLTNTLNAATNGLDNRITELGTALNARIDGLKTRFERLESRVIDGIKEHDQLRKRLDDHDARLVALENPGQAKP